MKRIIPLLENNMTLLTLQQQQELVKKGLAVAKTNNNLITFKYHRKVMYDYLWKQHYANWAKEYILKEYPICMEWA